MQSDTMYRVGSREAARKLVFGWGDQEGLGILFSSWKRIQNVGMKVK